MIPACKRTQLGFLIRSDYASRWSAARDGCSPPRAAGRWWRSRRGRGQRPLDVLYFFGFFLDASVRGSLRLAIAPPRRRSPLHEHEEDLLNMSHASSCATAESSASTQWPRATREPRGGETTRKV
jgi:hypothetical protein